MEWARQVGGTGPPLVVELAELVGLAEPVGLVEPP